VGTCSTHKRNKKCILILVGKTERRNNLENLHADGRTILKLMCKCVDWIHMAENRDQWWTLVNAVMNLRVP